MAGAGKYGPNPSGWIRTYQVITPHATDELPDMVIGFYAKTAGNVTFTTVRGDGPFAFPMAAASFLPCEAKTVTAWSGTAGDLYAAIR